MNEKNLFPLWNPFQRNKMNNDLFSFPLITEWNNMYLLEPIRISLKEKKDFYMLEADVSGAKKESLKVFLDNDLVTISGDFSNNDDGSFSKNIKVLQNEIFTGHAERQIHLDHAISPSLSKATMQDGKLVLHLHKYPDAEPSELKIQ